MEDGEEALRDEVEHAPLVRRQRVHVLLDVRRDDRVMIVDLRVVDDPLQRQLVETQDVLRSPAVLGHRLQGGRRRLQLRDHVPGQIAGRRARIRDRLLPFVQGLRRLQRAPRREAVAAVCVTLQRGEVVEQGRALGLLLALDLLDRAVLA